MLSTFNAHHHNVRENAVQHLHFWADRQHVSKEKACTQPSFASECEFACLVAIASSEKWSGRNLRASKQAVKEMFSTHDR